MTRINVIQILKNKIDQALRLLLLNALTPSNKSVVLVEYPKSGGTWLGQLVSESLKIPFPRNRFPVLKKALFHGHYLPKHISDKNKIIYLVRDGRDVLISYYHHQLIWNDKNKKESHNVSYHREAVGFTNFENVKENILEYMKYSYTHVPSKKTRYVFPGNWNEFNTAWLEEMKTNSNIYMVRYEDLLEDTATTLKKLMQEFLGVQNMDETRLLSIVEKYSFENQTKRKKGEENSKSFLRKGIQGDWKNYFDTEEKKAFKEYTEDLLMQLGYEKNQNW